MPIRVFAPAKINLALHVTGQRADGYHLLDTLVGFASVGDWLELSEGATGFSVSGPEAAQVPADGRNSVLAAAGAFGFTGALHLEKHLPVASGIGGGSADAAAAVRGIVALTGQEPAGLAARLLALGADVPMCHASTPARVRGIGEEIAPLPLPALPVVLVNPRVEVSTPAVFKALTEKGNPPLGAPPAPADLLPWLAARRNDLEPPAIALVPAIGEVLGALRNCGAGLARMSGSGATCFGIFTDDSKAGTAARALRARHPGWWVAAARLDGQDRLAPQLIRATT